MMKNPLLVTLISLAVSGANAADFDLSDMMPARPGQAVETTGEVATQENVVVAENEKDGLATAHQQLIESNTDGVRLIQVGSGNAIIAIGSDSYQTYENTNATLLSKRAAYNRAFMRAKKEMVQNFEGLQNSCESAASLALEALDTGNESLANSGTAQTEACKESVAGALAGFATYDVYDDAADKSVRVSIISSPKTRQAVRASVGAVYSANDPNEVFKLVMDDISKGLLPPVGAKVIRNESTGEVIVMGYGSSIVRVNKNASLAKKLRQAAEKQSQTLSRNAIVATMNGEKVFWEGGFSDGMVESTEQFAVDPELEDPSKAKALDEDRELFVSMLKTTDDYKTAASGKVPPGVKTKTFISEDGYWAYSVSVYAPSFEAQAREAKRDMESKSSPGQTAASSNTRAVNSYGGVKNDGANPQGPSGRVAQDADF